MNSRWRSRFRIPAPRWGCNHRKFQVHLKIYALFSLCQARNVLHFFRIRLICFLLCYFNWVIVNPTSPLAVFFPWAGDEVWDLPELGVKGKCRSGRQWSAVLSCWAGCPDSSRWPRADTLDCPVCLGVEPVCSPVCGEGAQSQKKVSAESWEGVGGRQGSELGDKSQGQPAGLPGHHHSHYCLSLAFVSDQALIYSLIPAIIHPASAKTSYIPKVWFAHVSDTVQSGDKNPSVVLLLFTVHSLRCVLLFVTPWSAALQASLSFTVSQSLRKLMFFESVMPSNHLVFCRPLLLLPSISCYFKRKNLF